MRRAMAGFFRWLAARIQPRAVTPSADRIKVFSPSTQPIDPIEMPELGTVYVRGLLLRDRLTLMQYRNEGYENVARFLSMTIVTEKREPVFDILGWEAYGAKHFSATMMAWQEAQDRSFSPSERAEVEGGEDEKKN